MKAEPFSDLILPLDWQRMTRLIQRAETGIGTYYVRKVRGGFEAEIQNWKLPLTYETAELAEEAVWDHHVLLILSLFKPVTRH